MSRVGWWIVGIFALAAAGFVSMTSFGIGAARMRAAAPAVHSGSAGSPDTLVVPVAGVARASIRDNWGDPRDGGSRTHHGTDISAPARTLVVAAAPGIVEKLFQSVRGGITLYVRSTDRRWTYYYAHLAGYAPNVREGSVVRAGDRLGYVGDTGDAGAGNYHLHFGLTRMQPGDRWWQGEDIDPYPLLAGGRLPR